MNRHTGFWESIRRSLEVEDVGFLAAICLLPWAFGGVEVWAYRSAALLVVAGCARLVARHGPGALGLRLRDPFVLLPLAAALWALFQLVPLPPSAVSWLSPEADAIYRDSFPAYADAPLDGSATRERLEARGEGRYDEAAALPPPPPSTPPFEPEVAGRWNGWRPISLMPDAGAERLLWFGTLWLAFVAIRRRCRSRERRRAYRDLIHGNALLLATFGLVYAATGNGRLYWFRETIEPTRPFGPFVNPTNFAALMELIVPWMTGCLMAALCRRGRAAWNEGRTMMLAAGILLGTLATLASATRSSSVLVAAGLLTVALVGAKGLRARVAIAVVAAGLVLAALPVLERSRLGERVDEMLALQPGKIESVGRSVTLPAASGMLADFWRSGCGVGAFRDAFPHYVPGGETARYNQLHNDFLEAAIEGGLPLVAIVAALLVVFWGRVLRPSALRSPRGLRRQQVGLVVGLALLTLHALWDFNHQIPGVALPFVALAAIAVARVDPRAPEDAPAASRGRRRFATIVAGVAVVVCAALAVQGWIGGFHYSRGRRLAAHGHYEAALPHVERGAIAHLRPATYWLAGQVRLGLWHDAIAEGEDPDSLRPLLEGAFRDYTAAIDASPASGWYRVSLGDLYYQLERADRHERPIDISRLAEDPRGSIGRWGRIGIGWTRLGIDREPNVYTFHDQLAFMFWELGAVDDAREAARRSAEVLPLYRIHAYDLLAPAPPELLRAFAEGIEDSVGKTPFIHPVRREISAGIVAMRLGDASTAERRFRAAVEGPTSTLLGADARFWLGRALFELGRYDEAAAAFRDADRHPNFAGTAPYWEGLAHERGGNAEAALDAFARARRADRGDLRHALGYARAAASLGQAGRAEAVLEAATRSHPDDPRPWRALLEIRIAGGDARAAREALRGLAAVAHDPAETGRFETRIEALDAAR